MIPYTHDGKLTHLFMKEFNVFQKIQTLFEVKVLSPSIQLHNKFWVNKVGLYTDIKGTIRLYFLSEVHFPELPAVLYRIL